MTLAPSRRERVKRHVAIAAAGLVAFLALASATALILDVTGALTLYTVPSGSMEPTIQPGNWILVSHIGFAASGLQRGDVIVFHNPAYVASTQPAANPLTRRLGELIPPADRVLVKRVIGLPGQIIQVTNGAVLVDGHAINEPYLHSGGEGSTFGPYRVPAKSYFVMGDNRLHSEDSRELFGHAIPAADVIGSVIAVISPPFGIHLLPG